MTKELKIGKAVEKALRVWYGICIDQNWKDNSVDDALMSADMFLYMAEAVLYDAAHREYPADKEIDQIAKQADALWDKVLQMRKG